MKSFEQVAQSITPLYEYQGFPFYNICHLIDAFVEADPSVTWGCWQQDHMNYREMLVEYGAEALDAYIYEYSRGCDSMSEAIAQALRNSKRAIILHDLS